MSTSHPDSGAVFRDPAAPLEERVADLLARMTIEEKVAQLGSSWPFEFLDGQRLDPVRTRTRLGRGVGQITRISGSTDLRPKEARAVAEKVQQFLRTETRMGIPAILHEECLHGVVGRDQLSYPQAIGMAATWDPQLISQIGAAIAVQLSMLGVHQGLAPILDVARDPRWGRIEETFGEDPYLTAAMAVAYVRALADGGVIATAKHLAGHGAPEGGMNGAPAHIGPRELADVYLLPFEAVVREGKVGSVMPAYTDLDGVPCTSSRWLLTEMLRDQWGFTGLVVSDYEAIEGLEETHRVAASPTEAAVLALQAGVDTELPVTSAFGDGLVQAASSRSDVLVLVDIAAARVLRAKISLGLLDGPSHRPRQRAAAMAPEAATLLALEAAQRSIVMLENDGLLPLDPAVRALAVLGPMAHDPRDLLGDYSYHSHIEALIEMASRDEGPVASDLAWEWPADASLAGPPGRSIAEAVRRSVSASTEVRLVQPRAGETQADTLARQIEAVKGTDVAVLVLGERSGLTDGASSGEARDRSSLALPVEQAILLAAVLETGTPTVVVVVGGRPPVSAELCRAQALLVAWLPGSVGGDAIANVLFGLADAGGRLPISIPRSVGQIPVYYSHKPSGGRSHWKTDYVDAPIGPIWSFGHGRSYAEFAVGKASLSANRIATDGDVEVGVEVVNTGSRNGETVIQLFVSQSAASVTRPVQQLVGFSRVILNSGQRARVVFNLSAVLFCFTGADGRRSVEPGPIELRIGMSAADLPITLQAELIGERHIVRDRSEYFSKVSVA